MNNDAENTPGVPGLGFYQGHWNWQPCKYRVVMGVVGEEPADLKERFEKHMNGQKRFLWFQHFIGSTRQMVEVHQDGQMFYMDNMDGSGLAKVQNGGHWRLSHYSVYPSQIIVEVTETKWRKYSEESAKKVKKEIDDAWIAYDPQGYAEQLKRIASIEAKIKSSRQETVNQLARLKN